MVFLFHVVLFIQVHLLLFSPIVELTLSDKSRCVVQFAVQQDLDRNWIQFKCDSFLVFTYMPSIHKSLQWLTCRIVGVNARFPFSHKNWKIALHKRLIKKIVHMSYSIVEVKFAFFKRHNDLLSNENLDTSQLINSSLVK